MSCTCSSWDHPIQFVNFDDAVSRVELIFEFDKNIAKKWVGFDRPTDENDGVCIIIKTVFSQELQSFV